MSILGKGFVGLTTGNERLHVTDESSPVTFEVGDRFWPLYCMSEKSPRLSVRVEVTIHAWTARVSSIYPRLGHDWYLLAVGIDGIEDLCWPLHCTRGNPHDLGSVS